MRWGMIIEAFMEPKPQSRILFIRLLFGIFFTVFLCTILNSALYALLGQTDTGTIFGSTGFVITIGLGVISGIMAGGVWGMVQTKHSGKLMLGLVGVFIGLLVSITVYILFRNSVNFQGANLFIGFFVSFCIMFAGFIFGTLIGTILDTTWLLVSQKLR